MKIDESKHGKCFQKGTTDPVICDKDEELDLLEDEETLICVRDDDTVQNSFGRGIPHIPCSQNQVFAFNKCQNIRRFL